jgi:molybdate transport system substrate-binding protein
MRGATGVRASAVLVFAMAAAVADAAEVRVYTSGAPAEAAKAIATGFARDSGHHLTFTVGQPAVIENDLTSGDKADVIILPAPVAAMLGSTGMVRAASTIDVARVGIGVVVRTGAAPPEIATGAAIQRLLREAHSIVYPDPQESGGGSAGRAIARMIDKMGMTEAVRPKVKLVSAIGGGVDLVASGEAEIGLFNISEIVPVKGVALVGPLPQELQSYIVFDAAIPMSNAAPEPAAAFIKRLVDPASRPQWQRAGLEPLDGKAP